MWGVQFLPIHARPTPFTTKVTTNPATADLAATAETSLHTLWIDGAATATCRLNAIEPEYVIAANI